mmetsp:Transcript_16756/g.25039  ORF Transcript_16756/g.25039 Transcript_16756/m.25039 type:complete len:288 (+) Transcript_16756:108-971(+)
MNFQLFFCFLIFLLSLVVVCVQSVDQNPLATWSEPIGERFVKFSYAAYCNETSIERWDCKWCKQLSSLNFIVTLAASNSSEKTFAFVGYSDKEKHIIVSFRGSHNLKNFIEDIEYTKRDYPLFGNGSRVHHGMFGAYQSLKNQVFPEVCKLKKIYPSYDVVVTGHSLGAAMATFLSADLTSVGIVPFQYDYGRPRTGNKAFAQIWDKKIPVSFRHVNNRDLVPHLLGEIFGFFHSTQEVWEHPGRVFKLCSETNGEDPTCSDSLRFPNSVSDHLHYFDLYEDCQDLN